MTATLRAHTFKIFVFILSCCTIGNTSAQSEYSIIKTDLLHFWEAYDALHPGADTTAIFQKLVIDRASEQFKQFIKKGKITAANYTSQVRNFPKFYRSIRANSLRLANTDNEIRALIKKFRDIYPDLHPADICIAFGNFYSGGTVYVKGKTRLVYIGLEYHGLDSSTVITEFKQSVRDYFSRSNFFKTIIHELVHVQQESHGREVVRSYFGDKLIHSVMREGVADFVAKHLYPYGNDGTYIRYGTEHENELRKKLSAELWQADKSYWIYNSNPVNGQPSDLGYFMGSRIAAAYYHLHKNKPDVIKQIIEIRDVKSFIGESGYFAR